jgi:hypothetical protein
MKEAKVAIARTIAEASTLNIITRCSSNLGKDLNPAKASSARRNTFKKAELDRGRTRAN